MVFAFPLCKRDDGCKGYLPVALQLLFCTPQRRQIFTVSSNKGHLTTDFSPSRWLSSKSAGQRKQMGGPSGTQSYSTRMCILPKSLSHPGQGVFPFGAHQWGDASPTAGCRCGSDIWKEGKNELDIWNHQIRRNNCRYGQAGVG